MLATASNASDLSRRINSFQKTLDLVSQGPQTACPLTELKVSDCSKLFEQICGDEVDYGNLSANFEHFGDEDRRVRFNALTAKYVKQYGKEFENNVTTKSIYRKEISSVFFPKGVREKVGSSVAAIKSTGFETLPLQFRVYADNIEPVWPDSAVEMNKDLYAWAMGAGAAYNNRLNKLVVYGSLPFSSDLLTYLAAHEIGHGIVNNSHLIKARNGDGSLPRITPENVGQYFGDTPDGEKVDLLKACLSKESAADPKSEIDEVAIREVLKTKNEARMSFQLSMNSEQIMAAKNADMSQAGELDKWVQDIVATLAEARTQELVADWFAAEAFANILSSDKTKTQGQQQDAIASVVKGFCDAGLSKNKTIGDHPSGELRIEKLMLANPRLRKMAGCQFRSNKAPDYCALN